MPDEMLEPRQPAVLDLRAWVLQARRNPVQHRQRQVVEILLHAVALTPGFGDGVFLKGGILMAVAYGSPRTTGDVDFSAIGDPVEMECLVSQALDAALAEAARRTGRLDLLCRVQRIERKPRPTDFADSPVPALEITVGSAARSNPREVVRLERGQASAVVRIDLSFREPIGSMQRLIVGDGRSVRAYGLYDLIAEKIRALLQQLTRPHPGERRQDVYDLSRLMRTFDLDDTECRSILAILRRKSRERGFEPLPGMIADARIVSHLRQSWPTLQDELEEVLPAFDETFEVVRAFYESLPWSRPEEGGSTT